MIIKEISEVDTSYFKFSDGHVQHRDVRIDLCRAYKSELTALAQIANVPNWKKMTKNELCIVLYGLIIFE